MKTRKQKVISRILCMVVSILLLASFFVVPVSAEQNYYISKIEQNVSSYDTSYFRVFECINASDYSSMNTKTFSDGVSSKSVDKQADENIEYTYLVENGAVNGNNTGTGIIEGGIKNNSYITVIPNNEVTQVIITVTSTQPVEKTIKAIFNLVSTGSQSTYSYTDYGDYGILMIKTGNSLDSDISVNYSGLYADNNSFINATGENGTIVLTDLEANSTYKYTFFESIENDYGASGIITGSSINI